MKDTVMNVMKSFIDNVFSFGFFLVIFALGMFYLLIADSAQEQARNAACLKAGMVKVSTDGGNFCVAPANLVDMK